MVSAQLMCSLSTPLQPQLAQVQKAALQSMPCEVLCQVLQQSLSLMRRWIEIEPESRDLTSILLISLPRQLFRRLPLPPRRNDLKLLLDPHITHLFFNDLHPVPRWHPRVLQAPLKPPLRSLPKFYESPRATQTDMLHEMTRYLLLPLT